MTDEQLKMTIFLKARIRKAAAEIVIQEVLLACFNSYDYQDTNEKIKAAFDKGELSNVHILFEAEYQQQLYEFFSMDSVKQNYILDHYINDLAGSYAIGSLKM